MLLEQLNNQIIMNACFFANAEWRTHLKEELNQPVKASEEDLVDVAVAEEGVVVEVAHEDVEVEVARTTRSGCPSRSWDVW